MAILITQKRGNQDNKLIKIKTTTLHVVHVFFFPELSVQSVSVSISFSELNEEEQEETLV